jgi:ParB-like chromosome segregation protein Spo0J
MHFTCHTMPVAEIIPAADNPRTLSAAAARKLRASITRFGLVEPLVWNQRTGRLVGGHQRLEIARSLGMTEVPVSVVDLDPAAEKALNVVLNNHEAQGRYDPAKLAVILHELDDLGTLADTGFDPSMLANLSLESVPDLEPLAEVGTITVSLEMADDVYALIRDRIDGLVAEHDLVAHVQRA